MFTICVVSVNLRLYSFHNIIKKIVLKQRRRTINLCLRNYTSLLIFAQYEIEYATITEVSTDNR